MLAHATALYFPRERVETAAPAVGGLRNASFAKIHPAESEKVECTGTRSAY